MAAISSDGDPGAPNRGAPATANRDGSVSGSGAGAGGGSPEDIDSDSASGSPGDLQPSVPNAAEPNHGSA